MQQTSPWESPPVYTIVVIILVMNHMIPGIHSSLRPEQTPPARLDAGDVTISSYKMYVPLSLFPMWLLVDGGCGG
jgi:hypothetical protein